jgi:hypothetical protein
MLDPAKLDPRLLEALTERGHDERTIAEMTPREAIREFAGWHLGDPSWGGTFFDLVENARTSSSS